MTQTVGPTTDSRRTPIVLGRYASLVGSTVTDLARTATLEVVPRPT